jgi:hypothetical protein
MSLDLDRMLLDLPQIQPPPELVSQVLGEVLEEMESDVTPETLGSARRTWIYPALAVAAALLLVVSIPDEGPAGPLGTPDGRTAEMTPSTESALSHGVEGNLDGMSQKGAGVIAPVVAFAMSVRTEDESPVRLDRLRLHLPGEELYFRGRVDVASEVALVRLDSESVTAVHRQEMQPVGADLTLSNGQLMAWQIDDGETSAVYALLAQPLTLDDREDLWNEVEDRLEGVYDPQSPGAVCAALLGLPIGCEAQLVQVQP